MSVKPYISKLTLALIFSIGNVISKPTLSNDIEINIIERPMDEYESIGPDDGPSIHVQNDMDAFQSEASAGNDESRSLLNELDWKNDRVLEFLPEEQFEFPDLDLGRAKKQYILPFPKLNRIKYICPNVLERKYGEKPPIFSEGKCRYKTVTFACSGELTQEEEADCISEFIPIAKKLVHGYFESFADIMPQIRKSVLHMLETREKALQQRCDADINAANISGKEIKKLFYRILHVDEELQAAAEMLAEQDILGQVTGKIARSDVIISYKGDSKMNRISASYEYSGLPEEILNLLEPMSAISQDEMSKNKVTFVHNQLPKHYFEEIYPRTFDLTDVSQPFNWKRRSPLSGRNGKTFNGYAELPSGYEHCSHSVIIRTDKRVCETLVTPTVSSVQLKALIRSAEGSRARGWLRGEINIRGIPSEATSCEREKYGCKKPGDSWKLENRGKIVPSKCNNSLKDSGNNLCRVGCECVEIDGFLKRKCLMGKYIEGRCVGNHWEFGGAC